MNRKALGRGLRSLIPEAPVRTPAAPAVPAETRVSPGAEILQQIDIDRIRPGRRQPRQRFDDAGLEALARSLREAGVLQPIIVRAAGDGQFELVAGERRWRAAQRAGLLKIPAMIREIQDDHLVEVALVENLQRENLNPIEEALAFRTLTESLGWTQQKVSERVGKQRATIANTLRLLTLCESVQQRVRKGELSMGQARAIAVVTEAQEQERLAALAIRDGLSVRQVERLVAATQRESGTKARGAPRRDPNVVSAEQALQRALGTRVRIFQGPKGGRLELHFFGPEELQRIYQLILDAARKK